MESMPHTNIQWFRSVSRLWAQSEVRGNTVVCFLWLICLNVGTAAVRSSVCWWVWKPLRCFPSSIMNSLVIVLFLSGMVAMIMLRTLHKDIARYNQMDSVVGPPSPIGSVGQLY